MKRALLALALLAGCHPPAARTVSSSSSQAGGGEPRAGEVASNIVRGDYAGSAACQKCHAAIYADWSRAPMHNMTRVLGAATVVHAPFAGEQFRFKDDVVTMELHDGQRYMRLASRDKDTQVYRVTKVIGGHHREDFAGVEITDEPGRPPAPGAHEHVLPATYMINAGAWRYKGYSVMTPERPGLRAGAIWSRACIFCHNTEPYLSDILGALAGPSTPAYQGEVVDSILPDARRWSFRITDEPALARALADEVAFLRKRRPAVDAHPIAEVLAQAVKTTRASFDEPQLVEVGIGCESCHGGSREHVRHVGVTPSYEPRAAFLQVVAPAASPSPSPDDLRAQQINRICARCHQVLFTKYPWTWEGAPRNADPGGSNINSGEGRDFLLGGCASRMSCVTCHDPHAPDNQRRMLELEGAKGSAICQKCHPQYTTPEAVRAHTHHDPAGAGGQCLSCHMPKKNMSLENRLTRYHRIGSPTDAARVEKDRPLECALCHADKTVAQLVDTMESWWNKKYDRAALRTLYGSLDANVVRATLQVGKAHEQAAALTVAGEARDRDALPLVVAQLTHPYPIVRYFAVRALEAILGHDVAIDLFRDDALIRADGEKLLGRPLGPGAPSPAPVGAPDGEE